MGFEFTNGILRQASQVIRHCTGNSAFITRKGGGHFYVLVRGGNSTEIRNLTKILNHTIRKSVFEDKTWDTDSAVESGSSCYPEDGNDLWTLLEKSEVKKLKAGIH
jgi:GGDEF domain-containing protein